MNFINQAIVNAFANLFEVELTPQSISLEQTKREFDGHVTFVVFPFLKQTKKGPEQSANLIGEFLKENCVEIADFNVIKGFLNLVLSDEYWLSVFNNKLTLSDFGILPSKNEKVMVEYSSPNTNKPLHLGHVRNNLLGFSVAEILKAAGYEVIKANLVNDRGIHICKSMLAWQKFGNSETPENTGLKGDHLVGKYYVIFDQHYKKEIESLIAEGKTEEEAKKQAPLILAAQQMLQQWEAGNAKVIELWKTMNSWVYAGFEQTYNALGVNFESDQNEWEIIEDETINYSLYVDRLEKRTFISFSIDPSKTRIPSDGELANSYVRMPYGNYYKVIENLS
jgi:arginyl-tRNA synthetase